MAYGCHPFFIFCKTIFHKKESLIAYTGYQTFIVAASAG